MKPHNRISNKLIWKILKARLKLWIKKQFKRVGKAIMWVLKPIGRFLVKKRYVGNYPKLREFILKSARIVAVVYIVSVPVFFQNIDSKEIATGALIDTKEKIIEIWTDFWIEKIVIERVGVSVQAEACDSPSDIADDSDLAREEMTESPSDSPEVSVGEFSAYNAEIGQTDSDPFTMASGKKVYEGAVANNCLPFGSKIELNGKIYTVEDRMNKRYGCEHFDLFFNSYAEAIEFGRQTLEYSVV